MGGALLSTMTSGDVGGQIRCLELLGRGFEEVNRHAEAMRFFDRAIKLADGDKDSSLPFMAYEGKAQALVALGKPNDAKAVIGDALVKARAQQKRGHEAELLIRARIREFTSLSSTLVVSLSGFQERKVGQDSDPLWTRLASAQRSPQTDDCGSQLLLRHE